MLINMERIVKARQPIFQSVDTKIDYWKMQVPTYESNFSTNPRWRNNERDPFICTAVFKQSYVEYINRNGGKLSRSSENMLPAFFVYESDSISLEEQLLICKTITDDPLHKNWVFSQTFSGGKSIHTLVWIDPSYREDVAKDFKFYWNLVGEIIFGKDLITKLDSQCASIGRLSRNPNGIRENNIKQTCIFFNSNFEKSPIPLQLQIAEHNEFLRKWQIQMDAEALIRQQKYANLKDDEDTKLEKIHNKGKASPAFELAYDAIVNNEFPKGGNYVQAAAALKGCGFSGEFIRNFLERASDAHPTNISKRSVETILKRLNV